MNKSDTRLLIIVIIISIILFGITKLNNKKGTYALVYYENKIIEKIDLNIDDKYTISGYNGNVVIEVKDNEIGVIEETSPYHLCSKQGFISSSLNPIICLPNKIVIKIESEEQQIDTVVR